MNRYAKEFAGVLKKRGYNVSFSNDPNEVPVGGIVLYLSCEKIYSKDFLGKNTHNLVVHASALPRGKGWSPLTWQILEGKNSIPITLFEATEKVDAGKIYHQSTLELKGNELLDEIREKLAEKILELVTAFIEEYPNISGKPQEGKGTFYKKRDPRNSELDPKKTLEEQFNLLRVVDNERYPAFFRHKGRKYTLKIYSEDE